MYSNGGSPGVREREHSPEKIWPPDNKDHGIAFRNGKCFIQCICPKCAARHKVYMLWTGRGIPRKYCGNCKPMVAGYDDAALYEASINAPGQSRKKGRCHEGD
jgi:hypothetical protein